MDAVKHQNYFQYLSGTGILFLNLEKKSFNLKIKRKSLERVIDIRCVNGCCCCFYRMLLTLHIVCFRCVVWWMINWICRSAWGVNYICVKSMSNHIRIYYEKQYEQHIVFGMFMFWYVMFCFGMFWFGMFMFWYVYVYVMVCLCFVLVCLCFGMFMWYVSSRYRRVPERGLLTGMCELHWILQLFLLYWIQSELRPDHLYRYITFNINFYPFVSSEFFLPFFFRRQSFIERQFIC